MEENRGKIKIAAFVIGIVAIAALVAMLVIRIGNRQETGLANRFGVIVGITDGDSLYHTDYYGNGLYKTSMDKDDYGTSVNLSEKASPRSFIRYGGDSYYYSAADGSMYKIDEKNGDKLVFEGQSHYHQFEGKYIYYVEPKTNYGGIIKRIPIKGGERETVLNVNVSYFAITGNKIVYYDPSINSLLETTIKNAMSYAADSGDEVITSAEIKATVLAENRYASNINVSGDNVYFSDASKSDVICRVNMKSGEITEMNFGTTGKFLNIYGDYIFYVGLDNALYRMNLDGRDIRNLTGKTFKEFAGFGLFEDRIVAYALLPRLNSDTMQTEYEPVIVVMDFEGTPLLVIPAKDDTIIGEDFVMPETELPEEGEVPAETEG